MNCLTPPTCVSLPLPRLWNFEDNRVEIKRVIEGAIGAALLEASAEIVSQAARNSRVGSGKLKGSWRANIDEAKQEAVIGSPLENAIWEEFGTGQYALNGDGRKTPWHYKDIKGNWHTTIGKTPNRALYRAFTTCKPKIERHFKEKFGAKFK